MIKYNGWNSRETWVVNLWFGDYFSDLASEGNSIDATFIEDMVNEHIEDKIGDDGFLADLLDLTAIDYEELATAYNDEAVSTDFFNGGEDDGEALASVFGPND